MGKTTSDFKHLRNCHREVLSLFLKEGGDGDGG
jgi:hypothetical protein